jgi:pimeloyl-ACP methyl ester carboxylesterase
MTTSQHKMINANGIELCYEDYGSPSNPTILLIMGLACQLTSWPLSLVEGLVKQGFRVIRYDNRDIGLSTEMQLGKKINMPALFLRYKFRQSFDSPYDLRDMSDDAAALLDALGIDSAHIVGVSMGGMIGQLLSVRHPEKVKTLTLMMTSDNSPRNPTPDLRVLWRMNGGGIKGHHLEAVRARSLAFWKSVRSPLYPASEEDIIARIEANYYRSYRPAGILRQIRAIMATGSLEEISPLIKVPVNIVHGDADLLVKFPAAEKLASRIPESNLIKISGMGHDLPEVLVPEYVKHIHHNISRAQ